MPIFDTPTPIEATIDLYSGDVRVTATDRTDTVVEIHPSDTTDASDIHAAEQTRVEFQDGKLLIKSSRPRALPSLRKTRSVQVHVQLPTGSQVRGDTGMGDLRLTGHLGECRLKSGLGNVEADHTGPLRLHTSTGNVTVDAVDGDADISTASGTLTVNQVTGTATVKNSNGPTTIGRVDGDLRTRSSNGDISVTQAAAGVDAKTANGAIRIGEVRSGSVVLKSSMGDIEVGIGEDTAAWLDVNTSSGRVRNSLDESPSRPDRSLTVEVRAQTSFGDIAIHRS